MDGVRHTVSRCGIDESISLSNESTSRRPSSSTEAPTDHIIANVKAISTARCVVSTSAPTGMTVGLSASYNEASDLVHARSATGTGSVHLRNVCSMHKYMHHDRMRGRSYMIVYVRTRGREWSKHIPCRLHADELGQRAVDESAQHFALLLCRPRGFRARVREMLTAA